MVRKLIATRIEDKTVKRNFLLNVFDGAVFALAMALAAQNTVIPVYIKSIGGGSIAIALIPVVWTIGFNFPQIFIANHASKTVSKKKLLLITGIFQRVFWFGLALVSFYAIPILPVEMGVAIFFIVFALAAVGGGFNLPGWFGLISKITPVNLRGRLFAWRVALGAVFGMIGGYIVKYLLDSFPAPHNYSLLFILSFLITMISYALLFFIKEENPTPKTGGSSYIEYLKYLPSVLKGNKNFRNFLIGDVTMIVAYTSFAFFTVDAIQKFSLMDSAAGEFTMIIMFGMISGSLLFGYLADHYGHRINLLFTSMFTLIACSLALFSPVVEIYYLVFICVALTQSLIQVSRLTIIAEMCSEEERPIYAALTNIVTVPFILSGIFAGWLAQLFGYSSVFLISSAVSLFALIWFFKMVEEPRKINSINLVQNN